MKLLGVSGSLTPSSRTNEVLRLVLEAAASCDPAVETELLDLRQYQVVFCDGRNPGAYEGDTRTVIDKVAAADAYVIASPMYRGSYTGTLKNLFDLVPNEAPHGKVAGLVATGGSDHHFLALEHELRPLLAFFQMHVVPGTVYAQDAHFRDGLLVDPALLEACRHLGAGVVDLWRALRSAAVGPGYPAIRRKPGE